jgi:hypothetical protein
MSKLIAKKFYDRAPDGTPVAYRTKYYHYYDGHKSRPVMGAKADAVHVSESEAETICRQLNSMAGGGFFCMNPTEKPERDRKPPKAQPEAVANG